MGVNNAEVISNRINTSLTYGWDNPGRAEDLKEGGNCGKDTIIKQRSGCYPKVGSCSPWLGARA